VLNIPSFAVFTMSSVANSRESIISLTLSIVIALLTSFCTFAIEPFISLNAVYNYISDEVLDISAYFSYAFCLVKYVSAKSTIISFNLFLISNADDVSFFV